jgi:asparagine synthase (glutamine-hydrolysing)
VTVVTLAWRGAPLQHLQTAAEALTGRILSSTTGADYPAHRLESQSRHPSAGRARRRVASQAAGRIGDVKLTWEIGRFPHAYYLARAAAFPERAGSMPKG